MSEDEWACLALIICDIAVWYAYVATRKIGKASQREATKDFLRAWSVGKKFVSVGAVKWTLVDDEWRHLGYDAGERGFFWKTGTTRQERRANELYWHEIRRNWIYGLFVFNILAAFSCVILNERFLPVLLIAGGCGLVMNFLWVFIELLYRAGRQSIPGAMVLDFVPHPSGQEEVENQKAHGEARLATEAEATAAAAGGSRRSSVHDQEF